MVGSCTKIKYNSCKVIAKKLLMNASFIQIVLYVTFMQLVNKVKHGWLKLYI